MTPIAEKILSEIVRSVRGADEDLAAEIERRTANEPKHVWFPWLEKLSTSGQLPQEAEALMDDLFFALH